MTRKATEEQESAELNNKLHIVKKSLEEQQHRNKRRYSKQCNKFQAAEEARTIAAKEAAKEDAERSRKARQQTRQKAPAKTTAEAENMSRRTAE